MLWGNATTEAGDFLGIIVSLDEMWLCKSLCFVFSMCSNCIQLDLTTATVNCNKILEKKRKKKSKYIQYHSHGFSYHSYADDTQHNLSYPQLETQEAAQTCVLPSSQWLSAHHLKLSLNKTKSSFFQGRHLSPMTFLLPLRTLWCPKIQVTWVWHWVNSCALLPKTTCSCRFILHYIRRICPFLTQEVLQDLVQALLISRLNYGNSAAHRHCWSSPTQDLPQYTASLHLALATSGYSNPI